MEIVSRNDGILCNHEVFDIVTERMSRSTRSNADSQNRETIERKLIKYMNSRDKCVSSVEAIGNFIEDLKERNISLTKAEIMVMLNHLPTTVVEIHLIVEECVERLDEDDIQYILDSVERNCRASSAQST